MAKRRRSHDEDLASSGHSLGQKVGDWLEEFFVLPLLKQVAQHLKLFLDNRFRARKARMGDKISWKDEDDNEVDYDFVMELDGTDDKIGIPVGFFECFWRRGKRHSKDKARDDSGKLMPMRDTYPTARFLGIVAGGDFTGPASTLAQSRRIDLFCVPKTKIISAFQGGERGQTPIASSRSASTAMLKVSRNSFSRSNASLASRLMMLGSRGSRFPWAIQFR